MYQTHSNWLARQFSPLRARFKLYRAECLRLGVAKRAKNSRENSLRLNSRRDRLAAAPVKSVFKVGQGKKNWPADRGTGNRGSATMWFALGEKFHRTAAVAGSGRQENAELGEIRGKMACSEANTPPDQRNQFEWTSPSLICHGVPDLFSGTPTLFRRKISSTVQRSESGTLNAIGLFNVHVRNFLSSYLLDASCESGKFGRFYRNVGCFEG